MFNNLERDHVHRMKQNRTNNGRSHNKKESAILSMPNFYKATQLFNTSPISKFCTYDVEQGDSGEEYLMKAIKNDRCVIYHVKNELEKIQLLEHPNLPKVVYTNVSDNYSYVVYEKLSKFTKMKLKYFYQFFFLFFFF